MGEDQFVRKADWLPVPAHEFAHWRAGTDMSELRDLGGDLEPVS